MRIPRTILSTGTATLLVAAGLVLPASPAPAAQPAGAQAPKCKGRTVTILGTEDADVIRGSNQRDVILALGGDDRIDGRGGNDVICGGAGRDLIKGGPGHDKLFGGSDGRSDARNDDGVRLVVGDVIQGGPGDDLLDLGFDERQQTFGSAQRDRLSYKDSAFRVIVTLGSPKGRGHARGDGQDLIKSHPYLALLGSNKSDTLTGSTYGDEILGRAGNDVIDGGSGRDVLVDGPIGARVGDDVLIGGVGRDELTSYGGHDDLDGGSSADALTVVRAPFGKTFLTGGRGGDVLSLGAMLAGSCAVVAGSGGADELVPTVAGPVHRAKVDVDLQSGAFGVRGRGGDSCGSVRVGRAASRSTTRSGGPSGCAGSCAARAPSRRVVLRHGGSVKATMAGW